MNKIFKILIVFFALIPLTVWGSNFSNEEAFVKKFADEAIMILGNDQIDKDEKNDQFTNLVMSAIDLNLISQFVLSKSDISLPSLAKSAERIDGAIFTL